MLPASLPVNGSFESMWRVVEGYLTRWRIEETLRFVKQAYGFENIRLEFLPKKENAHSTSENTLHPLFIGVRCVLAVKKWVNSSHLWKGCTGGFMQVLALFQVNSKMHIYYFWMF